jgi:hypothetical protein
MNPEYDISHHIFMNTSERCEELVRHFNPSEEVEETIALSFTDSECDDDIHEEPVKETPCAMSSSMSRDNSELEFTALETPETSSSHGEHNDVLNDPYHDHPELETIYDSSEESDNESDDAEVADLLHSLFHPDEDDDDDLAGLQSLEDSSEEESEPKLDTCQAHEASRYDTNLDIDLSKIFVDSDEDMYGDVPDLQEVSDSSDNDSDGEGRSGYHHFEVGIHAASVKNPKTPMPNVNNVERNSARVKDLNHTILKPLIVVIQINGQPAHALIDSGSLADFMSTNLAEQLKVP